MTTKATMGLLCGWALLSCRPTGAVEQDRASGEAPRVVAARRARGALVKELFQAANVPYPPAALFLRAFKKEAVLELWAGAKGQSLVLIKSYAVCAASGELGPKRKQGDGQVPEGFYVIDRFNPWSNFHLSLGIDYPNASDRVLADKRSPGGDVFIHGDCVTIGCIPIQDEPMEEVYLAAWDARQAGLRRIPVHIFPARMDGDGMRFLKERAGDAVELWRFWQGLEPGYASFEKTHRVPAVTVDGKTGAYRVR